MRSEKRFEAVFRLLIAEIAGQPEKYYSAKMLLLFAKIISVWPAYSVYICNTLGSGPYGESHPEHRCRRCGGIRSAGGNRTFNSNE